MLFIWLGCETGRAEMLFTRVESQACWADNVFCMITSVHLHRTSRLQLSFLSTCYWLWLYALLTRDLVWFPSHWRLCLFCSALLALLGLNPAPLPHFWEKVNFSLNIYQHFDLDAKAKSRERTTVGGKNRVGTAKGGKPGYPIQEDSITTSYFRVQIKSRHCMCSAA